MSLSGPSPGDTSDKAVSVATKRETIASRAKRIIGRPLKTPTENDSSGPHKGPPKKAPTKRREQVLQAQRTHRQRTQGYIKELEKEVLRLRESESSLKKQNQTLSQNNQVLEQHIVINNLGLPQGYESTTPGMPILPSIFQSGHSQISSSISNVTTPGMFNSDTDGSASSPSLWASTIAPSVHVDFTPFMDVKEQRVDRPTVDDIALDDWPQFQEPLGTSPFTSKDTQAAVQAPIDGQMALDFVLELERVCFPHLKHTLCSDDSSKTVPESNYGQKHVYMATTNILNHHHLPTDPSLATQISIPALDLNALFQTSLMVDFGSDVTPIQIWANISRLGRKGWALNKEVLQLFAKQLGQYMKCNGYGAVIQLETIQNVFRYFFPGEEYEEMRA